MHLLKSKALVAVLAVAASIGVAACGSSSSSSSKTTSATSTPASTSTSASTATPSISATSFTNNFSAMAALKALAAGGKGKVAAILPDTTSSTRYVEFDEPDLKKAMAAAGLPASDIIVQNGLGSDSTFLTDAQSDITNGATVLLIDPEDSGTGTQVENYAKAHGVAVIDYDRLTLGGSRTYYVSFNNVQVGKLIGQGFVSCVKAWHVAKPNVVVMRGAPTDNNATLFAQGYNGVLAAYFKSGAYKDVVNPAGTWDPPTALTEFEQAYTAHPNINSALIPNDENGSPIINYLKTRGVKANTFPTTGQDATLTGLQAVLSGYQCGTAYKPIYLEAQAAVALAMYLRAGKTPPAGLVNGTTQDTQEHKAVASVLLTPEWVTPTNMVDTIVKDSFVPTSQLCSGTYAADCKKVGISS
ncbi:MAG TPA: substrate-binding domain-containing protein [Solirubrobacteraceae bacterium]|jgi:D-xylose transport system substrate-binding protein|nr:substrate-binding domain-containing protein [Solirubrobacteraceae bacterium]